MRDKNGLWNKWCSRCDQPFKATGRWVKICPKCYKPKGKNIGGKNGTNKCKCA